MKVVLDTDVLVSAVLSPCSPCRGILDMVVDGELVMCVDQRILADYVELLQRPKFSIHQPDVELVLKNVHYYSLHVFPSPLSTPLPDPDDAPFLETAVAARAECLITGN